MGHLITQTIAGKLPKLSPDPAKLRDLDEAFALREAVLNPRIVIAQVSTTPRARERSSASVDRSNAADECGQVLGEFDRLAGISVRGDRSGQPRLD
jgi:hypothetical protein